MKMPTLSICMTASAVRNYITFSLKPPDFSLGLELGTLELAITAPKGQPETSQGFCKPLTVHDLEFHRSTALQSGKDYMLEVLLIGWLVGWYCFLESCLLCTKQHTHSLLWRLQGCTPGPGEWIPLIHFTTTKPIKFISVTMKNMWQLRPSLLSKGRLNSYLILPGRQTHFSKSLKVIHGTVDLWGLCLLLTWGTLCFFFLKGWQRWMADPKR